MNQPNISIRFNYDPKTGMVAIWVTPLTMLQLPFDLFRQGYYEMKKQRDKNKSNILVMDNNVVAP